jgi:hypothetical protein
MFRAPSRATPPDGHATSLEWLAYFTLNTVEPTMPWLDSYRLTSHERARVGPSIQQFQLGESSEGRGLLRRARRYAETSGDGQFAEAISLFIQEEQRHSRLLGRFLDLHSVPRLPRHWVDSVFRQVRALAGLEMCMRVLATAEIIAVPYYKALGKATASPLLEKICASILTDEAAHLSFQGFVFAMLGQGRPAWRQELINTLHSVFLRGTVVVVWLQHGSVIRAAGCSFGAFNLQCLEQFRTVLWPAREPRASVEQYSGT